MGSYKLAESDVPAVIGKFFIFFCAKPLPEWPCPEDLEGRSCGMALLMRALGGVFTKPWFFKLWIFLAENDSYDLHSRQYLE